MKRFACVLALASAVGCSSEAGAPRAANTPTELRAVVGAAGGTIRAADGTAVEIPPGALGGDVLVVLRKASGDARGFAVGTPAGAAIELLPNGLQFAKPVTIVLALDDATNDASRVVVFGNGSALPTRVRDAQHVEIQTTHF